MNLKDMKIKFKLLFIMISLLVASILVLGLTTYKVSQAAIYAQIRETLEKQVASYVNLITEKLSGVADELKAAKEQAKMIVEQQAKIVSKLADQWDKEDLEPLKNSIAKFVVGKTGYVYVLDYDGKYVVSKNRASDGKDISAMKDTTGRLFIKDIIKKGKALAGDGSVAFDSYSWMNTGETEARDKIVAIIHVPKYKWVIGVSAYYDDLVDVALEARKISEFKQQLKAEKVGETGYMYAVKSDGTLVAHPTKEGSSLAQYDFFKEMAKNKKGYMKYLWEGKAKVLAYDYYEPKDWIIASGSYEKDFIGPLIRIKNVIVLIAVLSLVVGLILSVAFANSITNPIIRSTKHLETMAQGDFSRAVNKDDLDRKDEIGTIAKAMNAMNKSMVEMIKGVKDAAGQLAAATEEISSSAQQISNGAQQQSASFEELTSSVQTNAENVKTANTLSQDMSHKAQVSGSSVESTAEAMTTIEKSSAQIAEAVNLITDIADQTNLLALNAAIEAARAGEHGKGFAVVADEVRQLAERSASSAKEIESLIKSTTEEVKRGANVSREAGTNIKEIVANIDKVAQQLDSISSSTQEQAAAMEQNSSVTESNAASSEELAASAEEMAGQADALNKLVERFKVS